MRSSNVKSHIMKKAGNMNKTSKAVQAIPDGFHTITPFLLVPDAPALLEFIEKGLGGKTEYITKDNDGKVIHASARIGDSPIMVADAMEGHPPTTAMLHLYVDNVDELYQQALTVKGAKPAREIVNEFYGDRAGCVEDQWGNKWWIATHIEDVSDAEIEERKTKLLDEQHA